jgi:pimeloyl-ACP methyl ester carboxylesterase
MEGWRTDRFDAGTGISLAVHKKGSGRPVVMLHGFLASSDLNWIQPGIADLVVGAGFHVVALDLRGHGQSDAPTGRAQWPKDILADDGFSLLNYLRLGHLGLGHLGLADYDLIGYSLGARTAARMLVRGARPRRAVLGGMGASGLMQAGARAAMFEDSILHGDRAEDPVAGRRERAMIEAHRLKPEAMLGVLASFCSTTETELRAVQVPTLVVSGVDDHDNGSAETLAALLPNGRAQRIPGDHLSAVGAPLGHAIVDDLAA